MLLLQKIFFFSLCLFVFSFFVTPVLAKDIDTDKDGLSDMIEEKLETNPIVFDTDGDGHGDGQEVSRGFDPLNAEKVRLKNKNVKVDLTTQQLSYYVGEIKIGSMPVSTGVLSSPTPTGDFKIIRELKSHLYAGPGYYLPNTKWNMEFKRSFYLHGAYWHNQFGVKPMSHGCVNIGYKDAEKLYWFLDVGDSVKIVGKTPRVVAKK